MKTKLFNFLMGCTSALIAQDKMLSSDYNNLIEVVGTEYVIASTQVYGKGIFPKGEYLLFINSKNGLSTQTDFPKDAQINKVEQVKLDSLGINKIIVAARTVNLDNSSNGINWNDPLQLYVYPPNGSEKTKITEDKFFTNTWKVNRQSGNITITGYYDSNNNQELDRNDKSEIIIFDLKTLRLIKIIE